MLGLLTNRASEIHDWCENTNSNETNNNSHNHENNWFNHFLDTGNSNIYFFIVKVSDFNNCFSNLSSFLSDAEHRNE